LRSKSFLNRVNEFKVHFEIHERDLKTA
jgi:hypothetical protein